MIKKKIIRGGQQFILMLTFLTRIPIKYSFEFDPATFAKGYYFFPIIGGIIGLLLSLPFFLSTYIPTSIFPLIIILLYLFIVGGIHVDGVSDLFDGIFSARDRNRILEIMEDSRVGAFGVIGLIIYFMGLYLGLYEVCKSPLGLRVVLLMPIISRTIVLLIAGFSRYAKPSGLGKSLVDGINSVKAVVIMLLLYLFIFLINPLIFVGVVITTLIMALISYRIHKILDGITGDVVGAVVEMTQVVFLLTMSLLL